MTIIGIAGVARSGKDTIADYLVANHGFVKVNLADQIKRSAQHWYSFTDEQIWGQDKDKPDLRYPVGVRGLVGERVIYRRGSKEHLHEQPGAIVCATDGIASVTFDQLYPHNLIDCSFKNLDPEQPCLTPRHAFQIVGTEVGRLIYPDTWVRIVLAIAHELLEGGYVYTQKEGMVSEYGHPQCPQFPYRGVVIADVRWPAGNEGQAIKAAGGQLWKVTGRGGLAGQAAQHASEKGMDCPDSTFDKIINNTGSIEELHAQVSRAMEPPPVIGPGSRCNSRHDNIDTLFGVKPCPVGELPKVCTCGALLTYTKEVMFVSHPYVFDHDTVGYDVQPAFPVQFIKNIKLDGDLFKCSAKDVEDGRLVPFDEKQQDVPPWKRQLGSAMPDTVINTNAPLPPVPPDHVRLLTGKCVPTILVAVIRVSLSRLLEDFEHGGVIQLYELVMRCRDSKHQFFGNTKAALVEAHLVQEDGGIHESIRDVVLAAVVGEDLDMKLINPIAENQS